MGAINTDRIPEPQPRRQPRGWPKGKPWDGWLARLRFVDGDLRRQKLEPLADDETALVKLSRDDVRAHIAKVMGKLLADELAADPNHLAYSRFDNPIHVAALMNQRRVSGQWRDRSVMLQLAPGSKATVGPQIPLVAENGTAVAFGRLNNHPEDTAIRFMEHTVSQGFANRRFKAAHWTDTSVVLEAELPAPMQPSDLVMVSVFSSKVGRRRYRELIHGIPYAPKAVTAEDIIAARS